MIEAIKQGDQRAIEKVYHTYRSGFFLFVSKYRMDREAAADLYQDAVIALIENIKKGKLDDSKVELKTYLFAIGKYMALRRIKKDSSREPLLEELYWYEDEVEEEMPDLRPALEKLGQRCYQILMYFYYENKKLEEIQALLGYDKRDVLKSQKSRCLKHLKELMKNGKN